jgi:hypothetical protein
VIVISESDTVICTECNCECDTDSDNS